MDGRGAHDAANQCSKERRRGSFSAYVAEYDCGLAGIVVHKVVEVTAYGASGQKSDGHIGVREFWRSRREQAQLYFAGHRDVALQLFLLAADLLIEPCVFNGNGGLRG